MKNPFSFLSKANKASQPQQTAPSEMSIEQKVTRFNEIFATDPAQRTEEETRLMKELAPQVNEYQKKKILGQLGAKADAKPPINSAAAQAPESSINKSDNDNRDSATENIPDDETTLAVAENADNSEHSREFVTLVDEDGQEHEFEVEAILDVGEEKYAVLIPMDEKYEESNEAVIMRFGLDEAGEEVLFDIESDEEWDKVADAYDDLVEEQEMESI